MKSYDSGDAMAKDTGISVSVLEQTPEEHYQVASDETIWHCKLYTGRGVMVRTSGTLPGTYVTGEMWKTSHLSSSA